MSIEDDMPAVLLPDFFGSGGGVALGDRQGAGSSRLEPSGSGSTGYCEEPPLADDRGRHRQRGAGRLRTGRRLPVGRRRHGDEAVALGTFNDLPDDGGIVNLEPGATGRALDDEQFHVASLDR